MGDVIEGAGGARKLRIQLEGRGKRGSGRVIYLDVFEQKNLYLLFAYPKEEGHSQYDRSDSKGVSEMSEPVFKSSLTIEEIEHNFEEIDFFSGIMDGLQEALAYQKGKAAAETFARKRALPEVNSSELRASLSMTQKAFADVLGVSCRAIEAWESGKSVPTPTAKKLMYLLQCDPSLVQRL